MDFIKVILQVGLSILTLYFIVFLLMKFIDIWTEKRKERKERKKMK